MMSLVTFANLGRKKNLKTADVLPVIKVFEDRGALEQVVCLINDDFEFEGTVQAVPAVMRYLIKIIEKIRGVSSRETLERTFDWFAARKLKKTNIVLFHAGNTMPKTFRVAKRFGAICVDLAVAAHDNTNARIEQEELTQLGFPGSSGFYQTQAARTAHVSDFDDLIALSEFARESYIENGFPEAHVSVAALDVDLNKFVPSQVERKETFTVLYVAHTQPLKGLHYLLDAWKTLSLPNAKLQIVGGFSSSMPEALRKRYEAAIASDASIEWVPGVADPVPYYQQASVFAFPSLTEGFGRVTLEAMACGLPVVTTENAKGIVEDGKTGFIVPIRDAGALAEKIRYLYEHQDTAQTMGREARRAVERKKPFGEAVYEIYATILARHNHEKHD